MMLHGSQGGRATIPVDTLGNSGLLLTRKMDFNQPTKLQLNYFTGEKYA
jgi:hypothetical protein